MMNIQDLKKKMMKLWKDTFHDSDAYISLIFDEYFDPELIEYQEDKNQVISAMIGIPFQFGDGQYQSKGLYLCGLATKEEFRHKGIMSELIDRINDKARNMGYAFSFLIPASDMLRLFYLSRGYVNGMYRVEERYTDIHDFNKDCLSMISREDDKIRNHRLKYYQNLSVETVETLDDNESESIKKITEYIQKREQQFNPFYSLHHSSKDILNILKENKISGGKILIVSTENSDIKGIVFITFDDRRRMNIPKIYYDDQCAFYKLLDKAKKLYSESPMSLWRYPEETSRHALWSKVYGAANPDGGALGGAYGIAERVYNVSLHSQPYGMIKILNLTEILKMLADYRNDVKFSILVKDGINSNEGNIYKVNSGRVDIMKVDKAEIHKYSSSKEITTLSNRDLSEILFRKKDGNSLIMEAFGIPRLAINIALMLD